MKTATPLLLSLPVLLAAACSSLRYQDPNEVEVVAIDFGSTDLQEMAGQMVDSFAESPAMAYYEHPGKTADKRVIVWVGDVENRTTEHIDTGGITDKIQTKLLQTGKYRFVASDQGQAEIEDQIRFQQSGKVREEMMRAFGKQLGADVVMYGTLRSIDKRKKGSLETGGVRTKDKYYQFVLRAVDIETAEILWQDEVELRKRQRTGPFGR